MDGLECKEVCKSELERTLRIDSEFYSKNYVEIYKMPFLSMQKNTNQSALILWQIM